MSTTPSGRKRGRPSGKATRRLTRELSNKDLLKSAGGGLTSISRSWLDASKSSPVVATASAITGLGILYRLKILPVAFALAGLALIGVIEAGAVAAALGQDIAGGIGGAALFVPSLGSKSVSISSQEDFAANSPNIAFGESPTKSAELTVSEKRYVPE